MCGEKPKLIELARPYKGSPPHVRGKVLRLLGFLRSSEDHPRMCGEKTKKIP